jgi:hypothetical protein
LHPHVLIKPFKKWDMDFVGPITLMSRNKRYILVCNDYVTKWVEAKKLLKSNEQSVEDSIYEDIFT